MGNQLLDVLSPANMASVMSVGRRVRLSAHAVLFEQARKVEAVHFPISAVLSLTTLLRDGTTVGMAVIGSEGTSGFPLLLETEIMANVACICEVAGDAISLPADCFKDELRRNGELRVVGLRYVSLLVAQLGQGVACSRVHYTVNRCASWLLIMQDRVAGDRFRLTHGLLAQMLGTRRASVTVALGVLTRADAISTHYGSIEILNRSILESVACECYEVIRGLTDRTLRSLPSALAAI